MAVGAAALGEVLRLLGLAQRLGGTGGGRIGHSVLQVVGHGLVEQVAGDVAVLHAQAVAAVGVHGRAFDRLEGVLAVDTRDVLHDGVGHDDDTRVADHAVGLVAPQVPDRQAPLLVGDGDHRIDDLGHALRLQDRQQRHLGPVGIPQREDRVGRTVRRHAHLAVGAAVRAVDVAEGRRSDQRVVKGRVEDRAGRLVGGLDPHLRQLVVPRPSGRFGRRCEVPAGKLRGEVLRGALDAHGRQSHLHEQLLALRRVELDAGIARRDRRRLRFDRLARLLVADRLRGFRELGHEVDLLILRPARRVTPAGETRLVVREEEARIGGLVPAAAVLEVEDHGGIIGRRERVAVHADARGGGELGRDAVAGQRHGVVAGLRDLLRAVGIGPQARCRILLRAAGADDIARDGHHRDVEQVADARTAQVRVREADDRRVALVVARAPVPRLGNARRTYLHHAEGHVGPHEDMAVTARADLRIDEAGEIGIGRRLRAGSQQQRSGGQ